MNKATIGVKDAENQVLGETGGVTQTKTLVDVYDPAMCCSTGVCGPAPDPFLPRFAADLWRNTILFAFRFT